MPHQLATFRDGDLTLSYEVHGRGERVLVYLHGVLMDSLANRGLASDLAAAGHRVILLDLPGHGRSDKPRQVAAHRMDAYARHVVHLLDDLGVEQAAVGGTSLGADVTLQVGLLAPERLRAMVLEMPVLELATPMAAMMFTPLVIATHYAAPLLRSVARLARRMPPDRLGLLGQVMGPFRLDPEELAAILHGLAVGPVAPTADERARMDVPALVIGHRSDRLHPFDDATRLAAQLPQARLVEARSLLELRLHPARLTAEICAFLDEAWSTGRVHRSA
jgi:pimeloyl-ACP methyl ester carboxylesterase